MQYVDAKQAIAASGLRIFLVQGFPSPWGQAAKAMMEYKGLSYIAAAHEAGGENAEMVAWGGVNSSPVVGWNDEPRVNRWNDILFLLERLAPTKSLVPDDAAERVELFGLAHEICGEMGFGWNSRLSMFQPVLESGQAPAGMIAMGNRYGYNAADVAAAATRNAAIVAHLSAVLKAQQKRGSDYFIGESLSAVDFYWAAFSNLVSLQSQEDCPLDPSIRAMIDNVPAEVTAACDPILIEHRNRIMRANFKLPMEL